MNSNLQVTIKEALTDYMQTLDGVEPVNLYDLMATKINKILAESVLLLTNNNQSKAAQWLGISRNTLRKFIKEQN